MAKVISRGWRKEPDEGSQKAYEILTGRNLKPFYPESHEQNTEQTK